MGVSHGASLPPLAAVDGASHRPLRVLIAIGALYLGFGVIAALLQGGLPPVLRARGMSMEQIAWTFALYLPLGLSFLWAPWVDRVRLPWLSPRIGWIVAAQAVAVAGVLAVAGLEHAPVAVLFGLGLLVAVAIATMDLALDALAVELTGPRVKPLAASLKLAALALGAMLGGGVFVGVLTRFGWLPTFVLVALLLVLTLWPVLGLRGIDHRAAQAAARDERRLFAAFRHAAMRQRLALLALVASVIFPLTALNRVMLVDLGVSLERIAWLVGTVQPVGLLLASLCASPLIRRYGHRGAFASFAALGLACLAALGWGYLAGEQGVAIAGTIGIAAAVGGMTVVNAALILAWSEGAQAATNYAVLFCGTRLASIVATVLAGKLVAVVGWLAFYGLGAAAMLAVAALMLARLRAAASDAHSVPGART